MNTVQVVNQLSAMPEGQGVETRRQRVTVLLAIAAAHAVPMPSSPIEATMLRNYFQEQAATFRDTMFKINEALPFDVDRSFEYAFRLYERRYNLAFNPKVSDILLGAPYTPVLNELIPELNQMNIQTGEVLGAVEILRGPQAE